MTTGAKPSTAQDARARVERYWQTIQSRDHFQVLAVDRDADAERIKASYKNLARQWHTDAYAGTDLGDAQETLDAIFKRITEAYETLTDPKKRAEYLVLVDRRAKGLSTDVNAILQGERLFDEALALLNRRNFVGAKAKLDEATKLNPDDALMAATCAWAGFNAERAGPNAAGAAKEAIAVLQRTVKQQENLAAGYQYLGQIHFALEQHAEAKRWWQRCLQWDPNNIEAARGIRLIAARAAKPQGGLAGLLDKLLKRK